VVRIRACDGARLFRIEYVLRRTCGCGATAGLRQPLLVARRLFGARCATCNAQACVQPGAAGVSPPWFGDTNVVQRETRFVQRLANGRTRAAGVSPPWFGDTNAVHRETRFVQRLANGRTRAAGVSPPWFEFALATATGFFGLNTSCAAHADAVPRLAYASRSWLHAHKSLQMRAGVLQRRFVSHGWLTPAALGCTTLVRCEMRDLQCAGVRPAKSGGCRFAGLAVGESRAVATIFRLLIFQRRDTSGLTVPNQMRVFFRT
jgi:hypothetical protein